MGFSYFYAPEYLQRTTTGLFLFRYRVPKDCQQRIGKKELKYSLKTRCIYTARKHLASVLPFIQGLFEGIRGGFYDDHPGTEVARIIEEGIQTAQTDSPIPSMVSVPITGLSPVQAIPPPPERPAIPDTSPSHQQVRET